MTPFMRSWPMKGLSLQSLYHFTIGGPVEDRRLMTLPPYTHLHVLDCKISSGLER